ncbi:hypothetical protein EC973_008596 [Apophysomyces ossiformis]|uniref:DUF1772-domain-containing protein n=1 Tax=Apophysomyces ossiformis TaxID=679940 RepID=A0A8H7BND8_9FUNG|nr:hypothetical protein EC973_008596 [Apophysomyces ossiformis]
MLAILGSGLFTGFALSINLISVPAIKATSDPLPSFAVTYHKGKVFAMTTFTIAAAGHFACYYTTRSAPHLWGGLFSLAPFPITIFMVPTIKRLLGMQGKEYNKAVVLDLVSNWNAMHWIRTGCGVVAFLLSILYQ